MVRDLAVHFKTHLKCMTFVGFDEHCAVGNVMPFFAQTRAEDADWRRGQPTMFRVVLLMAVVIFDIKN